MKTIDYWLLSQNTLSASLLDDGYSPVLVQRSPFCFPDHGGNMRRHYVDVFYHVLPSKYSCH